MKKRKIILVILTIIICVIGAIIGDSSGYITDKKNEIDLHEIIHGGLSISIFRNLLGIAYIKDSTSYKQTFHYKAKKISSSNNLEMVITYVGLCNKDVIDEKYNENGPKKYFEESIYRQYIVIANGKYPLKENENFLESINFKVLDVSDECCIDYNNYVPRKKEVSITIIVNRSFFEDDYGSIVLYKIMYDKYESLEFFYKKSKNGKIRLYKNSNYTNISIRV